MIRTWTDDRRAGMIGRHGQRGAAFSYDHGIPADSAVSMSMPVRVASWDHPFGIHPVFEMNLPEGSLRERLRLGFAKALGRFDDLDLLTIVGRSQVGRIRYTGPEEDLDEDVPFQSVDEILRNRRDGNLFDYMMEKFAAYSGVSGVQPKVMIRDETDLLRDEYGRKSTSVRGATHIVKFWEPGEFDQLAANEFFCLEAAVRAGLEVPRHRLSEDGGALVVDRFDLRLDGTYRGLEDFCVLNGRSTAEKYRGGGQTALFKRLAEFVPDTMASAELKRLFTLFVLNCGVRNGDAHLKNFALMYDSVDGEAVLAPVYDIVTTTVYIPNDAMALQMGGSTRWPTRQKLIGLAKQRCRLDEADAAIIIERVADALSDTASTMDVHSREHPEFERIGGPMRTQWEEGLRSSLGFVPTTWGRGVSLVGVDMLEDRDLADPQHPSWEEL